MNDPFQEAQAYFNAGNFRRCRELALQGLEERPDDVSLLRLVGKCSLQLNLDDAAPTLQRVVGLVPDDFEAWHELGDALVEEGELPEAAAALRESLRLRPGHASALVDLGHIVYAMGETDEAIAYLAQAAQYEAGNLSTLRSLVDMYRRTGRLEEAVQTARQMTRLQPDDVLATMDIAELSLALGQLNEAVAAYAELRRVDAEAVGGLDERFFMYSEELDWCRRFRAAGWGVAYVPQAEVAHVEGGSSRLDLAARDRLFQASKLQYAAKWHGPAVARLLRAYVVLEYLARAVEESVKLSLGSRVCERRARLRVIGSGLRHALRE